VVATAAEAEAAAAAMAHTELNGAA
jgi:hypothetical protein